MFCFDKVETCLLMYNMEQGMQMVYHHGCVHFTFTFRGYPKVMAKNIVEEEVVVGGEPE